MAISPATLFESTNNATNSLGYNMNIIVTNVPLRAENKSNRRRVSAMRVQHDIPKL